MAIGYFIRQGDKTSCGGTVLESDTRVMMFGIAHAREGDAVTCGKDNKPYQIVGGVSQISSHGRRVAGTLDSVSSCPCRAQLLASTFKASYDFKEHAATQAAKASAVAQSATSVDNRAPAEPLPSSAVSAPFHPSSSFTEPSAQICQDLWQRYQQAAEKIVAPDGVLIADPKTRNRAINAAYARLWLEDPRFQWAGLAAFASKQVGCGLLHAAESIEKIQVDSDAAERRDRSARSGFWGLFSRGEPQRKVGIGDFERRQREAEQAQRENPLWWVDYRHDAGSLSVMQKNARYVHDRLALGNTTLFLDVYPLHRFYLERGLERLEQCLPARQGITGGGWPAVLWPVGQETLEFGIDYEEIVDTFRAVEAGNIAESVVHLAWHEQQNVLQPTMYSDLKLVALLIGNQLSHVTNFPSGAAQAIELTLAGQCRPVDDERTIGFSDRAIANLADITQRMPFVLKAARQFDALLQEQSRHLIEQAIRDIAAGGGVR
ncbi:Zn-binding Pro-Ala-Ala-Arg (PAAR) domain-containing protein, incolved in TypeVI secretion [Pseudomonas sp. ok272]|uniref:PAAR domain-containing protein n=1 Tax=Pseudomonas sp. ok272 TaxID=1761897 RepID=UPI0008AEB51C|nr:PAAR domain-containing protein [Pseudomonas sp. ok272]SEM69473.1 Zn-binding Pro-Ala-Ala-Arg (PAAR) domain-containing protein, incolved in TypeVI secretion [Pseudomonas sp. ok272]